MSTRPPEFDCQYIRLQDDRWSAFVQNHSESIAFQLPAWSALIADCYRYRPFVAAALDSDGNILAGIPFIDVASRLTGRRWISLPFTDFCPPLFTNPAALQALTDFLVQKVQAKEVPKIEIRWPAPANPGIRYSSAYVIHSFALGKCKEELFAQMRRDIRTPLKKHTDHELQVEVAQSKTDLDRFYLLHSLTRKRLGVPVQPKRFFDLLWSRIIERGLGIIILAYHGQEAISGGVFLLHNKTMIYKYSALNEAFIKMDPNKHLTWKAVQWGCDNGMRIFNFGSSPNKNTGLIYFKKGWGAQETELIYSHLGAMGQPDTAGLKGRVMETTIRHSPLFVCQMFGELLYKHFG